MGNGELLFTAGKNINCTDCVEISREVLHKTESITTASPNCGTHKHIPRELNTAETLKQLSLYPHYPQQVYTEPT